MGAAASPEKSALCAAPQSNKVPRARATGTGPPDFRSSPQCSLPWDISRLVVMLKRDIQFLLCSDFAQCILFSNLTLAHSASDIATFLGVMNTAIETALVLSWGK